MSEENRPFVVVTSDVDDLELYRGDDLSEAIKIGQRIRDKHTLYIFKESFGNATFEINRCYAHGECDTRRVLELDHSELKHLITLIDLIK